MHTEENQLSIALAIPGHVGHHRHGHRAVDRSGQAMKKAHRNQGRVVGDEQVGKGGQAKNRQADGRHGPAAADDVGDRPGGHLEQNAGHRGHARPSQCLPALRPGLRQRAAAPDCAPGRRKSGQANRAEGAEQVRPRLRLGA